MCLVKINLQYNNIMVLGWVTINMQNTLWKTVRIDQIMITISELHCTYLKHVSVNFLQRNPKKLLS